VEIREEAVEPGIDETVVESRLMGISHGTEMLFFRGHFPEQLPVDETLPSLSGSLRYPLKYGYINVGINDEGRKVFAFYPHQDLFAISDAQLIPLPEALSFEDAVFLAHLETAVGIVQDLNPVFGERVLVLGQGTVGLLTARLLARAGNLQVVTVDPIERRREASVKIGCTALDTDDDALRSKLLRMTGGRGFDCAVNVSGSQDALQLAVDTLGFEGTLIEASWYGSRPVTVELGASFHRKRLKIHSSQVSHLGAGLTGRWDKGRRVELVIELLGELKPSKYISGVFALSEAARAFRLLDEHPDQALQLVLKP
jgi:threonine dehydrogenase-like Zn-dependent dehydrogenase